MVDQVKQMFASEGLTKLMLSVLTALIFWLGYTVQELTVVSAVQAEALAGLRSQISGFTIDRYTGTQAKADAALVAQRLNRLETWNEGIAQRLRELEDEMHETR